MNFIRKFYIINKWHAYKNKIACLLFWKNHERKTDQ